MWPIDGVDQHGIGYVLEDERPRSRARIAARA
jgi:hypothetical protein